MLANHIELAMCTCCDFRLENKFEDKQGIAPDVLLPCAMASIPIARHLDHHAWLVPHRPATLRDGLL